MKLKYPNPSDGFVRYETRKLPMALFQAVQQRAARTSRTMEWVVTELVALGLSRVEADPKRRELYAGWVERSRGVLRKRKVEVNRAGMA